MLLLSLLAVRIPYTSKGEHFQNALRESKTYQSSLQCYYYTALDVAYDLWDSKDIP